MLRVNSKTRELFVYDDIGPQWAGMVSALDFVEKLEELGPGEINVRLNSYGGTADEAFAAVEQLKRHDGPVNVTIDSIAASAASFFLNEAFHVSAAPTARVMIHHSLTITYGNAKAHAKTIEILNAYDESIAETYSRMKIGKDELTALLDAETWFTAKEALAVGLVDEINEAAKPDASLKAVYIPKGLYKNTPEDLLLPDGSKPEAKAVAIPTPNRIAAELRLKATKAKLRLR